MSLNAEQRRALELLAGGPRGYQSPASRRWLHRRHVGRPGPRGSPRCNAGGRPNDQGRALPHHRRWPEGDRRMKAPPMTATQTFRELTYTMRPQDSGGDGTGLRFETGEHGGRRPSQRTRCRGWPDRFRPRLPAWRRVHRLKAGGRHLSIRSVPGLDQGPQSCERRCAEGAQREV